MQECHCLLIFSVFNKDAINFIFVESGWQKGMDCIYELFTVQSVRVEAIINGWISDLGFFSHQASCALHRAINFIGLLYPLCHLVILSYNLLLARVL